MKTSIFNSKRFLSIFLAFVMMVGLVPVSNMTASAATNPTNATELQSAIDNGGTVKLGGDIDLGNTMLTFPDNTPVNIDLNGHNLFCISLQLVAMLLL